MIDRIRSQWAIALASMGLIAALVGGCGGGGAEPGSPSQQPILTIATRADVLAGTPGNTAEESVLGEIYAQALEGAGYGVKRTGALPFELAEAAAELRKGKVSGFPEHLGYELSLALGQNTERLSPDPNEALRAVEAGLAKRGLTAFSPAPYDPAYVAVALRATARKEGWKTLSDLEHRAGPALVVSGPLLCHDRIECAGGLEHLYRIRFGYIAEDFEPAGLVKNLESGSSDLAMFPAADGQLARQKSQFVTLEDDRHLFPAANAIFVTTPTVVREAGPKFEKTILAAQRGLTLPVVQELDARVELDHQTPKVVAAAYLKRAGLSG